jgi:hypothetical protein
MQLLTHFNFPLIFLLVSCQFVINLSLINPPARPSPDGITMCPWRPALLVVLVSAFHDDDCEVAGQPWRQLREELLSQNCAAVDGWANHGRLGNLGTWIFAFVYQLGKCHHHQLIPPSTGELQKMGDSTLKGGLI